MEKTFIKAIETKDGVLVRYRINNEVFVQEVLFQNYIFIKFNDYDKIKKIVKKYCNTATVFNAKNGKFVKLYLKNNFNRYKLKTIIEDNNLETFEADISAAMRYLILNSDKYNFTNLKTLWFDLETDDRGEFTKDTMGNVIAGSKQILSFAAIDEDGNEFYFINKNPDNPQAEEEKMLLIKLLELFSKYDICSAWNGNFFDFRYIEQRMTWHTMSSNFNFDEIFNLRLINKLDELLVYKKYTWNKHDSYALNSIANDELSDGKIDFSDEISSGRGKFYRLFKENPNKFKEYNLKDVQLMKRLDEKSKYYNIHKTTCGVTKCIAEDCLYTSHMADINLLKLNHIKNVICKSKPSKMEILRRETISVGGGYTFVCPGLYTNVKLFDFKSHYPLVMRTFNISQETFVTAMDVNLLEIQQYFNDDEYEWLTKVLNKNDQKNLNQFAKEKKLDCVKIMFKYTEVYRGILAKEFAEKNNLVWTPADLNNDTCGWTFHPHRFYLKEKGSLPQYVEDSMNERDKIKYVIKTEVEKNADFEKTNDFEILNLKDIALKIISNGAYGFTGLKASRFFDYHVADAITTTARWIIKKTKLYSEKLGLKICQMDTDSEYVVFHKFVGNIDDLNLEFYNYFKNELFSDFSKHSKFVFKNLNTNKLEEHDFYCVFEYKKKQIDSMISVARKRYYFLSNNEVKSVGGAMRKNDTNALAKKLQKELCYDIMTDNYSHDKWLEILNDWKDKCFNNKLDLKYLVFEKQYSKHHSKFGQQMLDKNGTQKISKTGNKRFAPVPVHIKLIQRLEKELNKELEVGDMIKYIIKKPSCVGLKCNSRKKIDREKFNELEILAKSSNLSIEDFKKLLEKNNVFYSELVSSCQEGISIDEYNSGELYDCSMYWTRIITPIIEILKTVYPRETIEVFGDIWNMSEKDIEKALTKLNLDIK